MIYMFLAEGFEEAEALIPLDLIRRADIEIATVAIGSKPLVCGAHSVSVLADMTEEQYKQKQDKETSMVFLPGGMPGTLNLAGSQTVINAVKEAYMRGAYIAAICAAPSILGDMGLLRGKEAICYPGFEDRLSGARLSDKRVVLDGKILTAAGMGAALDMGLRIIEIFASEEKAAQIKHAVIAD